MRTIKTTLISLLATTALASAANAYDHMLFAGGEVAGNNGRYGGIGLIGTLPGTNSTLGNGFVYRVMGEGLSYSYEQGTREIEGTVFGGEVNLGYQRSYSDKSWWATYAGPSYRNTDLSPNDPTNDSRGGEFGVKVQLEGEKYFMPDFKANLSGSYGIGFDSWWTRARLLYAPMGTFFIGPEFVYQGDEEFREYSIGGVINTILIDESTDIGFKGGYRKNEDLDGTAYGGIELSHSF